MLKQLSTLALISTVLALPAQAQANKTDSDWEFTGELYVQGTSISGDAGVGRANDLPVDVKFDDILDKLDNALMVHFEAYNKATQWGFILDYAYMDLRDKTETPILGRVASVRTRQGVLEGLAFKRQEFDNHTIDYFGGIRWWDNDISARLHLDNLPSDPSVKHKEDWVDAVIGARYWYSFAPDWRFHARADIGGLGLQSDFTSTLYTGFEWQATDAVHVNFGYKATWVDYENSSTISEPGYFQYDTVTKGPTIGVAYKF
ncbi:hypothetical protein LP316_07780 [Thalassotalea sp. LPB0316]|uniref:hypothetical protein n=1 Tax=Thalassotalea sp. LPB0316 TaxID=2769490 RepID=UPI001868921D|nr:hypothetical protein [Thalassotalea sp. LPB0316]QOL27174.1 hypothetical protein LP316_07780 [Thalassotalea sp. LPB0316]